MGDCRINKHRIYVASSWRNEFYPEVVETLRAAGHDVYDFRNPPSGDEGFKWSGVSADYMEWSPEKYREMLGHEKAVRQFKNDIEAMESCDVCVLVLPCGRSAHTEAGWFVGRGCRVIAYIPVRQEPELMYKLFSAVCCSMEEVVDEVGGK
ncbi:MAG: nucleoside 2-deoxyribosyltransferase [Prevotella sp.]|nr:nucleoside 2-deoxyribosyltransferase [Prevotella sp.]